MVSALVSLLAPGIAAGVDGKAGGLLTANPFDALGAGPGFSSLLSFAGKNGASLEKLNELLTTAGADALAADRNFASLLQLPGQDPADLDKVDMIDQSVMVAAIMLPVLPTQQTPEPVMPEAEESVPTDEVAELPEIAPVAAVPAPVAQPQALDEALIAAETPKAKQPLETSAAAPEVNVKASPAPKTAPEIPMTWFSANALLNLAKTESGKGKEHAGSIAKDISENLKTTIQDITDTVDVTQIVPLEKLLPSLAQAIVNASSEAKETTDAPADDVVAATPAPVSAAPDVWGLIASALKPFSAGNETNAKPSEQDETVTDTLKAAPNTTTLPVPKEEFKIPTKAALLGFDKEEEDERKPQRKEAKTKVEAAPQAAVQPVDQPPSAPKITADNPVKSLVGEPGKEFTGGDSMDRQSGNANQIDQRAGLIDSSANKDQKIDPAFLKLVKTNAHEHASPAEQVMVSIKHAVSNANQSDHIRVQLTPHDLGSVDITMTIKGDEITNIRIIAEKSETLDLLKQDGRFLERSLQESGLKAETGGLQFGLKEQNGGNAQYSGRDGNGNSRSHLPYDGTPSQGEDDPATLKWNTTGGTEVLMATTGINIKV